MSERTVNQLRGNFVSIEKYVVWGQFHLALEPFLVIVRAVHGGYILARIFTFGNADIRNIGMFPLSIKFIP